MNNSQLERKEVLILCTGNSCRSHMAEGLINHYLGNEWTAYSAGTEPTGYVHPLAVAALAEFGIDISENYSKSTEAFRDQSLDWVITVCDDAAENCPLWLGQGNTAHISFPDPAKAVGTDEEKMQVFRQVRDDIRRDVLTFLSRDAE
ncbi:MAG: arsenate reductase ArsC [Candidatus Promineifilaceae bacterium]|nr:arsenate reductase ArsC [Candidatus Promineifilaceae bacterium]